MDRRVFLANVAATLAASSAFAGMDCNSCSTAEWQASRQPYTGATAPVQVDACVRLLVSKLYHLKSEVVLVEGSDAEYGRVITSLGRGNGFSFQLANQPAGTEDIYIREFCFEKRLIMPFRTITFCNGANRGDGNHHTLSLDDESAPYLRRLRKTGHVGDFLSLLGTRRTYRAPVSTFFTERRYAQLYGRGGDWISRP